MTTLQHVELGVLGPLQVRQYGLPVAVPGAKPRAVLTMLGLHGGSVVSADTLAELLWGARPPRTAAKALQTHVSSLRRTLGDGYVLTEGTGWTLNTSEIDATRYKLAARLGRDAIAAGDAGQAVARFDEALALWRGIPELPDGPRGGSEKTRWIEGHAALVEDRADALLATGRAAEIVGELEAAIADAPMRERRWGQLMLGLYRAGRQGEALGAYQRARSLLADELGVDPGPDLRRLETAIVAQDAALEVAVAEQLSIVTRAVTFLLTDIEGSTAAWEADADAMAVALARHDEIVEQVVTSRGGRLVKTRGEGDATFSVFDRPSAAAAAAIELQEAIRHEPWALAEPMRIRIALHTGEVELRDGDYFGRAVNRAARLRSLAAGGQILCSGATAELVIDTLSDDVVLADLGMRHLRNLARPEHVFELRLETAQDSSDPTIEAPPMPRPVLPTVLAGPGPFVGRGPELEGLLAAWQATLAAGTRAMLIAGEPGVGKTRLAGEWSRQAYEQGAVVLYGRCDEDLGAAYQPFAEALRSLVPCVGASRLRGLRGVEALLPLVPGLTDVVPDLSMPSRSDPDTERYALFDAVVALLAMASASAPVVLILDDLHWAAKPTLLLLRHLLRFGEHARVQIVGTYRSTDLDRSHPLAAMLADLHRDGSASRLALGGLDEDDVTAYVAEAGYDDVELARALASVTGGNPFFLIEALRHVDESGGRWDPSTLPQGVREAVSRRLSRLSTETNKALGAAAVVGSRFALALVEKVIGEDLIDAFDEACKAGIVIEEPGGRYRFNHALVRQSLLAELASVRRMRLHQKIATTLEAESGGDEELLAELAYHFFECAWAGNAVKAVEYCRRAADQAIERLAYEGAADLYDRALHALEEIDDELPDREAQQAELLVARCEALLAAGDVGSAAGAVAQLQRAAGDSVRLAAWGTCFDGQLSMLTDPERLDEIESEVNAAAQRLAELDDAAGEANAHTVRAACLARLGRIGDCETALDQALTAARRARDHRRVNAVLAGAPLAALWGPNPVPRAGGRCLDVVRLLRITTGSPVVEATSTRCQGVLDAMRGRAAAGRQLIDSARRALTELGMRHALLEVDQFAGIVELVADDPASAEPLLRRAYDGFRRMGLDADTAETAALLARTCLALDRDAEADELCRESERLAGHALKPSIAWRTVRAQLLSRGGAHDEACRVAQEAVAVAERTDELVDHGDACLGLASVLGAAGDVAGARSAAEQAVALYERKGAAALVEKARSLLGSGTGTVPLAPEPPTIELENECVRTLRRVEAAVNREDWSEVEQAHAPIGSIESRRKIVGFERIDLPPGKMASGAESFIRDMRIGRSRRPIVAVRGERFALARTEVGTADDTPGAPLDEMLHLVGLDEEGRIALQIWFDVEDLDAAIAELDEAYTRLEEQPVRTPLGNSASRASERYLANFAARDWDAMAAGLAPNYSADDRRRIVNAGIRNGRDAEIENFRVLAVAGATLTLTVVAIRGEHLALTRITSSNSDAPHGEFESEMFGIVEIDSDERIATNILLDPDHFNAAIAELDARYLAGMAAAYSHTWLVMAQAFVATNRRVMPEFMPGFVNIDHRRARAFAPGDLTAYIRATWDLAPDVIAYAEAVHKLSNLGAVFTQVVSGNSQDGFNAEWREICLATIDGNLINRIELFEEADIDTALARFDALSRPAPQLENAASQVNDRFDACLTARDWSAMAAMVAEDMCNDDRRRVVGAGIRRGRDAEVANMQAIVELGVKTANSDVVATRGQRLALLRTRFSGYDQRPEAFHTDIVDIVEINGDNRITRRIAFDADDLDAAFEELDAQYLAGEVAAYAQAWSVVAKVYVAHNRRQVVATTPDAVSIDHRRVAAFAPGEGVEYIHAGWDLLQDINVYIEAVHRIGDLGLVFTFAGHGTSHEGFAGEWRGVNLVTVDGELVSRSEIFDEGDIDAALAKFDELSRPVPPLENSANRILESYLSHYAARDWDIMARSLADDFSADDRRRTVNSGVRHGRDGEIENVKAMAELGCSNITSKPVAIRGERLVLARHSFTSAYWSELEIETFDVVEIDADDKIVAEIIYDADALDAAFAELDARYVAGEAAAHAHTWSVIANGYAALNRHELPPTPPNFVNLDHRRGGGTFAAGDLLPYVRASWDDSPDNKIRVEIVHRLNSFGAVVSSATQGASVAGFAAEWREIGVVTVDGDMINRTELFDESDLGAALARFDELSCTAPQLENAASRADDRFFAHFAARDWAAIVETLAEGCVVDDRRGAVNVGLWEGRDAVVASLQALAEAGPSVTLTVIATRGERLALSRIRSSRTDTRRWDFGSEMLHIVEIDTDGRITAHIEFETADLDAAYAELDARYIAGEAAANAHTWSVIAGAYAAVNRHELPAWTHDTVNIDHRSATAFAPGDLAPYLHATWGQTPDVRVDVVAVHRLTSFGALVTHVATGTAEQGFEGEWREITLSTIEGNRISRSEMFDEADLDTALVRFDELQRPTTRLENTASLVEARCQTYIAAGDWDAMAAVLADDVSIDDRRRVVNAGLRRGRDAVVGDLRVGADIGLTHITPTPIALRGERLTLRHIRYGGGDQRPEAGVIELVQIVEIDEYERITALVLFEPDDIEAAVAELDARYVEGEAADHARTWSVITENCAALNQQLLPAPPSFVYVDRRRVANIGAGDVREFFRAAWELTPNLVTLVESVHRLSDLGAVVSQVAQGTSDDGFYAEWRVVNVYTVDGGILSRCEVFDEADLDAALARFDELSRPVAKLENAASRLYERFNSCYTSGDWDGLATTMADDFVADDRRRFVGTGGSQVGRNAAVDHARVTGDLGVRNAISTVIAIRGQRLALMRARFWGRDERPDAFHTEVLHVIEMGARQEITTFLAYDLDEFDAALAELDARYLAGEAAEYSQTWYAVLDAFAALNRHELPSTTPDMESVDHRPGIAFASGDVLAYIEAMWDLMPEAGIYIESVHRLSDLGAVVTHAARGISPEGFDAEWRVIDLLGVNGNLISRTEVFDDSEVAAAVARFDELSRPASRIRNAASKVAERFRASFAARDWDAMAAMLADDLYSEDRRRVVNAGIRHGRDSMLEDMRSAADIGVPELTSIEIATRGERLVLVRAEARYDVRPGAFYVENLAIAEIDADQRVTAQVIFDLDDIDAAFEELDARYLAGEAAQHANTWTVITQAYAGMTRGELPATATDLVNVDHRRVAPMAPNDGIAYLRASWDLAPEFQLHIEAVHRLSDLGAVFTRRSKGTSQDGFDAEWRAVDVITVEGDLINRGEIFDESDLDAALARFDKLGRETPRLENAASRMYQRYIAFWAVRDWAALAELLADEISHDDRRSVVNGGIQRGRDLVISNMRAITDVGVKNIEFSVIATRGDRLAIGRSRVSGSGQWPEAFGTELLNIVEVDADNRFAAGVAFDVDDIDAAFAELDARYLAGDAAAHAHTWSVIAEGYAAFNRHELPPTTPDWTNTDHRRGGSAFAPGEQASYIHATWQVAPNVKAYTEIVYRLNTFGAVVTQTVNGRSTEGFDAEWREITVLIVEGDLISRVEIYDEGDLDAALAKFDELTLPTPRLENAATRARARIADAFNRRDLDAFLAVHTGPYDDRRKGLRNEGPVDREFAHALLFEAPASWHLDIEPVAIRGRRLALSRDKFRDTNEVDRPVVVEVLTLAQSTEDECVSYIAIFDSDDIEAAFEELDARYLAGEGSAHAGAWSDVIRIVTAFNRREVPATTADWVNIDHRRGTAFAPGELTAYLFATWELSPTAALYIEEVHRLTDLGAVVTLAAHATSHDGFAAEWRVVNLFTFEDHLLSRVEVFDESDVGDAVATFDELSAPAPLVENAATRARAHVCDAYNRRDAEGFRALAGGRYEDRRKGLRSEGEADRDFADAVLSETPTSWRLEFEPVAIRGNRLALSRDTFRDTSDADLPITVEVIAITDIADELVPYTVFFDPDDIDAAFAELTARWIASGAVAHPEVIEAMGQLYDATNRHDWDALATIEADAAYVNHRQLATGEEIADHWSSLRMMASLIPDLCVVVADIPVCSAHGVVSDIVVKGTTAEGAAIELPAVIILLFDGARLTHMEAFDLDQRDQALDRFEELST